MNSNTFDSGFNTIADQFRNKGVASNKQRMAGDYLSEFTKDTGVREVLGGNRDYRNGTTNERNTKSSSGPSAVMSTLGAKPAPAPTPGASVSKAKAATPAVATPASLASPDDAYDFRAWAEATHKDKGGSQSVDYWEKQYRQSAAEAAKRQQAIDSYTGPITGEEWAAHDQQNFDNNPGINEYTSKLKSSYATYSKYHSNVYDNKQWEAASAKWKKK